jgi:hypothetical protein
MTLSRKVIEVVNRLLRPLNLQLESLTLAKREQRRLKHAGSLGIFAKPVYPIPSCFERHQAATLLEALPQYREALDRFTAPSKNKVDYQFSNGFFSSPDAEILYTVVRTYKPKRILEIGCGNSTRIIRQAIIDGALDTNLTCLDPYPRRDIVEFADTLLLSAVEDSPVLALVAELVSGDILFIDTSHEFRPANDCAYIYGVLIPRVPAGVIIHIHDIFLPYEYPETFANGDAGLWGEQYAVRIMLQQTEAWDALWPGHYLQRTLQAFAEHFPHLERGLAQSLWLRKR